MTINDIGIARYLKYLDEDIHEHIYKIEFLRREDETPYVTIEDDVENNGGITNSFNEGVRRTASFDIINNNLQYNDMIEGLTAISKFKVSTGYIIDGEKVLIPQGVYFFDDPTISAQNSNQRIMVGGTDKWSGLNGTHGGTLEATYLASAGSNFSSLIKSLLLIDISADPIDPLVDSSLTTITIPFDITRQAGSTVSDMILEACFAVSAYCYYDETGRLVVKPFVEDNQKGDVFTFDKNNPNYITGSKTQMNSQVFNSVQITADNVQSSTVLYYEAINNRLDDKNSFANLGKKLVKPITEYTKGISTQADIERRASWELQKYTLNDSRYSISCRPIYTLDVDQVALSTDDRLSTNGDRCLMTSISTPIGTGGTQNIQAKKAVDNFE